LPQSASNYSVEPNAPIYVSRQAAEPGRPSRMIDMSVPRVLIDLAFGGGVREASLMSLPVVSRNRVRG
jgi:hypothetical protein